MNRARSPRPTFTHALFATAAVLASLAACSSADLSLGKNHTAGAPDSGKDAPEPVQAEPDSGADSGASCNNGGSPSALPAKLACTPPTVNQVPAPPATWGDSINAYCNISGARRLDTPCGGYLALSGAYPNSADGQQVLLYDATTLKFVAALEGKNDEFWSCAGPSGLAIDTTGCFHRDDFGFCAYAPSSASLTPCGDSGAPLCSYPPVSNDAACPQTYKGVGYLGKPCASVGLKCAYPGAGDPMGNGCNSTAMMWCVGDGGIVDPDASGDGGAGTWIVAQ